MLVFTGADPWREKARNFGKNLWEKSWSPRGSFGGWGFLVFGFFWDFFWLNHGSGVKSTLNESKWKERNHWRYTRFPLNHDCGRKSSWILVLNFHPEHPIWLGHMIHKGVVKPPPRICFLSTSPDIFVLWTSFSLNESRQGETDWKSPAGGVGGASIAPACGKRGSGKTESWHSQWCCDRWRCSSWAVFCRTAVRMRKFRNEAAGNRYPPGN